jgi:hypothetical protein
MFCRMSQMFGIENDLLIGHKFFFSFYLLDKQVSDCFLRLGIYFCKIDFSISYLKFKFHERKSNFLIDPNSFF